MRLELLKIIGSVIGFLVSWKILFLIFAPSEIWFLKKVIQKSIRKRKTPNFCYNQ